MSVDQLTTEPASLYAGDTINWLISLQDYPASAGWTLKYTAVNAAGYFTLTSTASGDDHLIQVATTTTDDYDAGDYTLTKYVESLTERVTLAELALTVKPDLAALTAGYDNRSHVKKVLDAIEAVLEGRASTDQQEVTIDGTTIKKMSVADLLKLRSQYFAYYQQELQQQKLNSGLPAGSGRLLMRL